MDQVKNFLRRSAGFTCTCKQTLHSGIYTFHRHKLSFYAGAEYIYEDVTAETGVREENAAYIYLTEQNSPLDSYYFYDTKNGVFKRCE